MRPHEEIHDSRREVSGGLFYLPSVIGSLTAEQQAAVSADGDVLLMAGAGTGKTATLVGRVLSGVTRPVHPWSLDRVLMVTFTEAAGAEMRHRLRAGLRECADKDPDNLRLSEQLALLDRAMIGTLHSFCLSLIRENFHRLGLDPQPVVLEEGERRRLRREALDTVVERGLERDAVRDLVDSLFLGDPGRMADEVAHLHDRAVARADAAGWLSEQEQRWGDWEGSDWDRIWWEELDAVLEGLVLPDGKKRKERPASPESLAGRAEVFLGALGKAVDRESRVETLASVAALGREKACPAGLRNRLGPLIFLHRLAPGSAERMADWENCARRMRTLVELTRDFRSEFLKLKRERAGVDFGDLEQFTLELVRLPGGEIAAACRRRFDTVLVDECQDLTAAQEAILTAVSRKGSEANRFLVGDLKQSIYRFRLADPALFQALAEDWKRTPGQGTVLSLTGNFRSAENILDFVNGVFGQLLSAQFGGMDYDENARLRFGATAGRGRLAVDGPARVDVRILTAEKGSEESGEAEAEEDDDASDETTVEAEAREIAARFREWHGAGLEVWDRNLGCLRRVRWGDMAVLLRSPAGRNASFVSEFARAGVPLAAPAGGVFEQREVALLWDLLRVLDNPLQDIPLAAVLRSPIAGIPSLNELLVIRLLNRGEPFWTSLQTFVAARAPDFLLGDDPEALWRLADGVRPRVEQFLDRHTRWRRLARSGSMQTLLETIIDEVWVRGDALGIGRPLFRRGILERLLDLARRFDLQQRSGLHRFLGFLEDESAGESEVHSDVGSDSVRLLSVHRSKGLEFPVVAVAGLGNPFNLLDLRRDLIVDDRLGLCPVVVIGETRFSSLVHFAAGRRQRSAVLAEELRLLYVAFTRAGDRLLLVGSRAGRSAGGEEPRQPGWNAPLKLAAARRPLDWLEPALAEMAGLEAWAETQGSTPLFSWDRGPSPPRSGVTRPEALLRGPTPSGEPAPGKIGAELVRWEYPHCTATTEAAKQSVTGLRRRVDVDEDVVRMRIEGESVESRGTASGRVAGGDPDSGRQRGLVYHRFLEKMDLSGSMSEGEMHREMQRLTEAGELAVGEIAELDVQALVEFWQSSVGELIRGELGNVRRELPFTLRLSANDLAVLGVPVGTRLDADEFIVVQGVADLVVQLENELWLVDFKTDVLTRSELAARVGKYQPQLAVYALGLSRILRRPVTRRWLHFFSLRETVEL